MKLNNKGAAHYAVALLALLVLVVGYAGYRVYQQQNDESGNNSQANETSINGDKKDINNTEDAQKQLDDIESVDIDSELDTGELESDLDQL